MDGLMVVSSDTMEMYDNAIRECLKRNYTQITEEALLDIEDMNSFLFYAEENLLPDEYRIVEYRVHKFMEQ